MLYVEVRAAHWSSAVPAAREYVVVRRLEPDAPMTSAAAAALGDQYKALLANAGSGVHITGLQIDYDCPTRSLKSYAGFLEELRRHLPGGARLSITALLDWFGGRTDIARVIRHVDEFVPQFYDAAPQRTAAGIAEPIDARRWAPVFNAFQVPYRIGVASFGRVARRRVESQGRESVRYVRDLSPLALASSKGLVRTVSDRISGEQIVNYHVTTPIDGRPEFQPGDDVEVTFPTPRSVAGAVTAAKQFGGHCAGVVVFRWPGRTETLAFDPADVARIVSGDAHPTEPALIVQPAVCIERRCSDLYLAANAAAPTDRLVHVRASDAVERFIGGPLLRTSSRGGDIFVRVPAYAGLGRLYLGRAIAPGGLQFEIVHP
jgi:hypothetical protein